MFKYSSLILFLIFILTTCPALSHDVLVTDGDTIRIDGLKIRLFGIDAPELNQKCLDNKAKEWDCGKCARSFLEGIIVNREIHCKKTGTDLYKRTLAICYIDNIEINKEIIKAGYGLAYYSKEYINDEQYAKLNKKGVWGGKFTFPSTYRKQRKHSKKVN